MGIQYNTVKSAYRWQIPAANNSTGSIRTGPRFEVCPYCGREGYYQIARFYEHCTYCGVNRLSLKGDVFL